VFNVLLLARFTKRDAAVTQLKIILEITWLTVTGRIRGEVVFTGCRRGETTFAEVTESP